MEITISPEIRVLRKICVVHSYLDKKFQFFILTVPYHKASSQIQFFPDDVLQKSVGL